jgi:hypothetical protein
MPVRACAPGFSMSSPGFSQPVSIYINWAAYDLLSDAVPLTEELAMTQLDHLLRLRRAGVRFDYYLMDCFWFDPDGGYRTWDKRYWSEQGPQRWIERCQENGVLPGLWVATNSLETPIFRHLNPVPAWEDSLDADGGKCACLFHGGYLADFVAALQSWVDRGIRLFKFDFAELHAAPAQIRRACLPSEIRRRNSEALRAALTVFRERNPTVKLIGYNGLDEERQHLMEGTSRPLRRLIDTRWLDVFDSVYCGDPRPADVPCANFWRSKDIYSDHMVRCFEANGYPLPRIDNAAFMIGTTGTCYDRRKQAWRGMLVLSLARGGWANTYYGNLDLLTDDDGRWFAAVQAFFLELQRGAVWQTFGALPGSGRPYGFQARHRDGDVITVVNPSQSIQIVELPSVATRVLFSDAGFVPQLAGNRLTLGPEQVAVVASGALAAEKNVLGTEPDVVIPQEIRPVAAEFKAVAPNRLAATFTPPSAAGRLRLIFRQARLGVALRSTGGAPPHGTTLGNLLRLEARQGGRTVPITIRYDLAIWSGLSWAVGEIATADLQPAEPLALECSTTEAPPLQLTAEVLFVS